MGVFGAFSLYQPMRFPICSRPLFTTPKLPTLPLMTFETNMLPSVESSHPGTQSGRFFSAAATSHESFGSIWYSGSSTLLRMSR